MSAMPSTAAASSSAPLRVRPNDTRSLGLLPHSSCGARDKRGAAGGGGGKGKHLQLDAAHYEGRAELAEAQALRHDEELRRRKLPLRVDGGRHVAGGGGGEG